jgi:hypothetical protein
VSESVQLSELEFDAFGKRGISHPSTWKVLRKKTSLAVSLKVKRSTDF